MILLTLIKQILPIYFNIILGFLLTKIFKVKATSVAFIVVYLLAPLVIFFATLSIEINLQLISLPLLILCFSTSSALFALVFYKRYWKDSTLNTLSFTCGSGNTGYFGIPLALIILEPQAVNIYIFLTLASTLYEYTLGYYLMSKGQYTSIESIKKVFKLPIIYAFILGITLNLSGFTMPDVLVPYFEDIKFLYGLLGMMILGMGFKAFNLKEDLDKKFIFISYLHKFLFWPLFMIIVQIIDRMYFNFFSKDIYFILFLYSLVPMAGNTVTFAVLLNTKPQKASFTVLLSTLISLLTIPLMILLYEYFLN